MSKHFKLEVTVTSLSANANPYRRISIASKDSGSTFSLSDFGSPNPIHKQSGLTRADAEAYLKTVQHSSPLKCSGDLDFSGPDLDDGIAVIRVDGDVLKILGYRYRTVLEDNDELEFGQVTVQGAVDSYLVPDNPNVTRFSDNDLLTLPEVSVLVDITNSFSNAVGLKVKQKVTLDAVGSFITRVAH